MVWFGKVHVEETSFRLSGPRQIYPQWHCEDLYVSILQYTECVCEMHDFSKILPPLSEKGGAFDQSDWSVRKKEFTEYEIRVATKDDLPIFTKI